MTQVKMYDGELVNVETKLEQKTIGPIVVATSTNPDYPEEGWGFNEIEAIADFRLQHQ